jgi:hypothetical protein
MGTVHQIWSEEGHAIAHDHHVCLKEGEELETASHQLAWFVAVIRNPYLPGVMESRRDRSEIGEACSAGSAVDWQEMPACGMHPQSHDWLELHQRMRSSLVRGQAGTDARANGTAKQFAPCALTHPLLCSEGLLEEAGTAAKKGIVGHRQHDPA